MNLKVMIPEHILLEAEAVKVTAEGGDGSFCLLPRHEDFLSALSPGILSYETPEGEEVFLAVDVGILIKRSSEVLVSSARAVLGPNLEELKETIENEYKIQSEREKKAAMAIAKLEISFMRRLLELEKT